MSVNCISDVDLWRGQLRHYFSDRYTIPAPIKCEWTFGLISRFEAINPAARVRSIVPNARCAWKHRDERRAQLISAIEVFAALFGVTCEAVLSHNTTWPIDSITMDSTARDASHCELPTMFDRSLWSSAATEAKYCTACARSDVQSVDVGWWHREHQQPTMFFCAEHHEPLLALPMHTGLQPTHLVNGKINARARRIADHICRNAVVNRYASIYCAVLRGHPIGRWQALNILLARRADLLGLRRNRQSDGRLFWELASDVTPEDFLRCVLGGELWLQTPIGKVPLAGVCGSRNLPFAAEHYLLALAILFDDVDDALKAASQSTDIDILAAENAMLFSDIGLFVPSPAHRQRLARTDRTWS